MSWSAFLANPLWLLDAPSQAERERRWRQLADQGQGEDLSALARRNAQLEVLVAALLALLAEKGVLSADEVRRKAKELGPQPVSPGEQNPFDGLGS